MGSTAGLLFSAFPRSSAPLTWPPVSCCCPRWWRWPSPACSPPRKISRRRSLATHTTTTAATTPTDTVATSLALTLTDTTRLPTSRTTTDPTTATTVTTRLLSLCTATTVTTRLLSMSTLPAVLWQRPWSSLLISVVIASSYFQCDSCRKCFPAELRKCQNENLTVESVSVDLSAAGSACREL